MVIFRQGSGHFRARMNSTWSISDKEEEEEEGEKITCKKRWGSKVLLSGDLVHAYRPTPLSICQLFAAPKNQYLTRSFIKTYQFLLPWKWLYCFCPPSSKYIPLTVPIMRWVLGGPNQLPSKGSNISASHDRGDVFQSFQQIKDFEIFSFFLAMVGWVGWWDPARFPGSPFNTGDFVGCYWLYYYLSLEKMYLVAITMSRKKATNTYTKQHFFKDKDRGSEKKYPEINQGMPSPRRQHISTPPWRVLWE